MSRGVECTHTHTRKLVSLFRASTSNRKSRRKGEIDACVTFDQEIEAEPLPGLYGMERI